MENLATFPGCRVMLYPLEVTLTRFKILIIEMHAQSIFPQICAVPVVQVVVLPSPSVEAICEAVHLSELLLGECCDAAKVSLVQQAVLPLVDGDGEVLGVIGRALVQIPRKK